MVILLILSIVLSIVGFTHAYWSETLTITGTVETGELEVKIYTGMCKDENGVAVCSWTKIDDHTIRLTISNAYPGCIIKTTWTIRNKGTIPVKLKSVRIENVRDPDGLYANNLIYVERIWMWVREHPDKPGHGAYATPCYLKDMDDNIYKTLKDYVIHPGGYIYFMCSDTDGDGIPDSPEGDSVWFKFLDGVPENATLSFDLVFEWTQYNAP